MGFGFRMYWKEMVKKKRRNDFRQRWAVNLKCDGRQTRWDGKSLAASPYQNRPNQLTYESFPSLSSLIGSLRETRGVTSRLVHVGVGLFRTTTTTTESCGYDDI